MHACVQYVYTIYYIYNTSRLRAHVVLTRAQDADGTQHVRYQQTFRGIPIWGEQVIVSEDKSGNLKNLFGRSVAGLGVRAAGDVAEHLHELSEVAHHLGGRRHLHDVTEHVIHFGIGIGHFGPTHLINAQRARLLAQVRELAARHAVQVHLAGAATQIAFESAVGVAYLFPVAGDGANVRPIQPGGAVGVAQGALDFAIGYMKERRTFGRPLADIRSETACGWQSGMKAWA